MAWIIQQNLHEPVDVLVQDIDAAHKREEELSTKLLASRPQYPPWHPEYVDFALFHAGIRHPPIKTPFEAQIVRFQKPLVGMFDTPIGRTVSASAIRLIEAVDPGAHRYVPLDLTMPDGSPVEEPHYILNVGHRADAIAIDESPNMTKRYPRPEEHPDWFWLYCPRGKYGDSAVYKDRVADLSIWYDWRLQEVFLSDQIVDLFIENGILRFEEKSPYYLFLLREV
ncbi:MAG: DUF1629 domain-containing protein [Erythrobacter sp.]